MNRYNTENKRDFLFGVFFKNSNINFALTPVQQDVVDRLFLLTVHSLVRDEKI